MRYSILIILSCLSIEKSIAQDTINYLEDRKSKMLSSCVVNDLVSVEHDLSYLLSINPDKIITGLYDYYYDLGMIYYVKAFMYKQSEFEDDFYLSYFTCIQIDPKRGEAYHSLAVQYYINKKFKLANTCLLLYKIYTDKVFWDKDLINQIESLSVKKMLSWSFFRGIHFAYTIES